MMVSPYVGKRKNKRAGVSLAGGGGGGGGGGARGGGGGGRRQTEFRHGRPTTASNGAKEKKAYQVRQHPVDRAEKEGKKNAKIRPLWEGGHEKIRIELL